jgi:hypothetical protein
MFGVLIPAVIAGIVLLFCGRGTGDLRPARPFLGALALGLGFLIAYRFIVGMPRLPAADVQIATHAWLAWFVLGAIVLAPLRNVEALARWANPLYMALFAVLTFRFPLANQLSNDATGLVVRFGLTLVMYVAWNASDQLAARLRGPALPMAWVVAGTGIALAALFSRTALLAQLAGVVTAGLGAAAVVGWIDKGTRFADGAVAITWIVFAGVLVNAGIYDLPKVSIALLVIALLAPWVATRKTLAGRPLAQSLLAMTATAVPVGIALWIAYRPEET